MEFTAALLARLDEIGKSLESSGHALALIGLGSVGLELERLDVYSDLDFFAIVEQGYKQAYILNLDWLEKLCPVVFRFQNTPDGYKLLFEDGIFCEFAVFEQPELEHIPFAPGRLVWGRPGFDPAVCKPVYVPPRPTEQPLEWQVNEALTNLYVGMGRFRRGEKLSAARFIQNYAVDRILELAAAVETSSAVQKDVFTHERRFEQRFPNTAACLPQFIQGYERSPESALAILDFLESRFEVNPALAAVVRGLCRR